MTCLTIAKGDGSRLVEPRRVVARDAAEWRMIWAAHAGPELPAPDVDFGERMVAAVFAGERPSPGHSVEITGTRRDGVALAVLVEERQPPAGAVAAQVLVSPFHIVSVPRYDGDVRFVAADTPAGPPPPRRGRRHVPSTTGLPAHVAASLAYLAGPFSGLTILLAERANPFVRFHAWQAIIGLGALAALAVALLGAAFLALLFSPTAFTTLYRLSALVAAVWLVAWAVCLYAAFTGKWWELPLAGKYAARKADGRQAH